MYGPICEQREWRIRSNTEIYGLYEEPTLVAEINSAQIRWLSHLDCLPDERWVKRAQIFGMNLIKLPVQKKGPIRAKQLPP